MFSSKKNAIFRQLKSSSRWTKIILKIWLMCFAKKGWIFRSAFKWICSYKYYLFQRNLLHPKYVALILREAASSLKKMPNLSMVSTAVSQQVTVCGDLHGKLDDLLVVFYKVSKKSPNNPLNFKLTIPNRMVCRPLATRMSSMEIMWIEGKKDSKYYCYCCRSI